MRPRPGEIAFEDACELLASALEGTTRQEILTDAAKSPDLRGALVRLRDGMRANIWKTGARQIALDGIVKTHDTSIRQTGFHVLHDWDGKADRVNDDIIPIDVLNFVLDKRGAEPTDGTVLAILLDYYFVHVLALLSLAVWEQGNADDNLDRLNRLLQDLQGPHGSGQRFADNAGTLILLATSHYELEAHGFGTLLNRVRTLNRSHRMTVALAHAASLGSHLRFGLEATYAADIGAMRQDNVVDYPWLCFALATMMKEYARLQNEDLRGAEREALVEALLNGLSPDALAFVGHQPPASLSACAAERSEFCDLFHKHKADLLQEAEAHRPSDQAYSPISFFFNFSHNVLKGTIIDALLWGEPWNLTFNDLLTGIPKEQQKSEAKEKLARTLMGYARSSPDRIRGRLMPVIVYDPEAGRRAFALTMRRIRG